MKGLFSWVGFKRIAVPYHRHARVAGSSKFSLWRLWNFALEGITGFSTVPLRAATYMGLATAAVAFVFGVWVIAKAALYGDRVAGWPTMMAVILFLGGVQLIALGLIGEYLGRLYEESKQRPLYLVDAWLASAVADSALQPTLGGQADDHGTATVGRQVS
ncbi:glucosyl transferase [Stenotrophomonas maltophilia RA8]|nr:glucosyl transferase [Stenotrophomonas maltophilia RA8]